MLSKGEFYSSYELYLNKVVKQKECTTMNYRGSDIQFLI